MATTFVDDDPGFLRWRDTHPRGFIVNHDRNPRPSYLKLHHATCRTLQGAFPAGGGNWTIAYAKTCSEDLNELRRWVESLDGELDPCQFCAAQVRRWLKS